MLRDLTLHMFSRVVLHVRQWKTRKVAFSEGVVDESAAATDSNSICIDDSAILMTFIPISLLAAAWILILMHFLVCFGCFLQKKCCTI